MSRLKPVKLKDLTDYWPETFRGMEGPERHLAEAKIWVATPLGCVVCGIEFTAIYPVIAETLVCISCEYEIINPNYDPDADVWSE